jgi:hypothetical protein
MKIYKSMMQIKGPTEALDYLLIRWMEKGTDIKTQLMMVNDR